MVVSATSALNRLMVSRFSGCHGDMDKGVEAASATSSLVKHVGVSPDSATT